MGRYKHIRLISVPEEARKYVGHAKAMLERIDDYRKMVRAKILKEVIYYPNSAGGVEVYAWITTASFVRSIRFDVLDKCPSLTHGLADPHILRFNPSTNVTESPLFEDPETGEKFFDRFYPRDFLEDEIEDWQYSAKLKDAAFSFLDIIPGKFSGEMRAVVQDIYSRGQSVPYSYSYYKTHGIYTTQKGTKYVIEISDEGIAAWKLELCPFSEENSLDSLDYIPKPTTRPKQILDENDKLVNPPSLIVFDIDMSPAYDDQATIYGAAGWAFSASGAKASAVTIQELKPNPSALFYTFSRLWT